MKIIFEKLSVDEIIDLLMFIFNNTDDELREILQQIAKDVEIEKYVLLQKEYGYIPKEYEKQSNEAIHIIKNFIIYYKTHY